MASSNFWAQEQKLINIKTILSWIEEAHKNKKSISKEKLINVIVADIGCSNPKAKEYLQILEGKGNIQIDHDIIIYNKGGEDEKQNQISTMS